MTIIHATSTPAEMREYSLLREHVAAAGLLQPQYWYFVFMGAITVCMAVLSLYVLWVTDNIWVQLLNALLLAFVHTQAAFLLHDSCHRQIFRKQRGNDVVAYICAFFIGGSPQWWMDNHNRHHADPNHDDMDPDIAIPFLAYTEEHGVTKRGVSRFIVEHQGWFFLPLQSLANFAFINGILHYFSQRDTHEVWLDGIAMMTHFVGYFMLIFTMLPFQTAVAFVLAHRLAFGFHMGMVFATNHKGMPIYAKDSQLDFLRKQVFTSRNIKSNMLIDFLYGGLNYQVEHHLFPTMPRGRLRQANKLVERFCAERRIPMHQTGVLRSYVEVIQSMREISKVVRQRPLSV